MANMFCQQCGQPCPQSLRLCPACGGRSFGPIQPTGNAQPRQLNPSASTPVAGNARPIVNPATGASVRLSGGGVNSTALAGRWARLLASIIDSFLLALASSVLSALGNLVSSQGATGEALYGGVLILGAALVPFVYFTLFHRAPNGSTPGKRLFGLKVVMQSGEGLTTITAFVRVFLTLLVPISGILVLGSAALVPAMSDLPSLQFMGGLVAVIAILICLLGPYATIFFTSQRLSIYDMICKTLVIKREAK